MQSDKSFEQRLQALLDGQPLPEAIDHASGAAHDSLQVIAALTRIHRTALFGKELSTEPVPSGRWGHLEIRGEIGRGASGTVYRAWDTRLRREVALKLFEEHRGSDAAAWREAQSLARLRHPHIVTVYGADIQGGIAGVWMELLEGDTLEDVLLRDGIFSEEEALLVGIDVTRALAAVHSTGLIHRDVKARNVFRERGGRVVLMDLETARFAEGSSARGSAGTPMYMAPEVLGGSTATPQSDIYSVGVLLFRLLTGGYPHSAATLEELRQAHAASRPLSVRERRSDIGAGVADVIAHACDPLPNRRHESAGELESALLDAFQQILSRKSAIQPRVVRSLARRRTSMLIASIGVCMLAGFMGFAWNTSPLRSARRHLGWTVPPRSPLYLTTNGGLMILRDGKLTIFGGNPGSAVSLAASSDLGVQTMAAAPPWTSGGSFDLEGRPARVSSAPPIAGPCCFTDGTTDGQYNYAIRQDSTGLDPIGSRPLLPPSMYRFRRDWSHPEPMFLLSSDGTYTGTSYSAHTHSFWVTRMAHGASEIEEWTTEGQRRLTAISQPSAEWIGIAADPADGTLWVVRAENSGLIRLENFDLRGRWLGVFELQEPPPYAGALGAEFSWQASR